MTLQKLLIAAFEAAAVVCALIAVSPSWGQTSDSATAGQALFEDTPNASGMTNLTASCTNCHASVQDRRIKIGGSAHADIGFDLAMTRFTAALQGVPAMAPFRALGNQQVRDLATYVADTPKTSAAALDFSASATNTPTLSQPVDLRQSVATTAGLRVEGVAVGGSGASRFATTADTCTAQTLPAGASCRVSLRYAAPDTAAATASLTMTLREVGASTSFTRSVALNGTVAVVSAPAPASAPVVATAGAAESGGGALGWPWLAGLAAATALARRAGSAVG
jgi:cytochrome c553